MKKNIVPKTYPQISLLVLKCYICAKLKTGFYVLDAGISFVFD